MDSRCNHLEMVAHAIFTTSAASVLKIESNAGVIPFLYLAIAL
jgi:hypothetical protein